MGSNDVDVYEDEIYTTVPGLEHFLFSIEDKFHICSHACHGYFVVFVFQTLPWTWVFILLFPFSYFLETTSPSNSYTCESSAPMPKSLQNLAYLPSRKPKKEEEGEEEEEEEANLARSHHKHQK